MTTTQEDQQLIQAVNQARNAPRPWRAVEPQHGIAGEPHAVYVLEDAEGTRLMLLVRHHASSPEQHQATVAELVRSVNATADAKEAKKAKKAR